MHKFGKFRCDVMAQGDIKRATARINKNDIFSGMVFYAESIVHWAKCNGIAVEDDFVVAVTYSKRIINAPEPQPSSIAPGDGDKILTRALETYNKIGGDAKRNLGDTAALIGDICCETIYQCHMNWSVAPSGAHHIPTPINTYHHFLIKCAYLIGVESVLKSLATKHTDRVLSP